MPGGASQVSLVDLTASLQEMFDNLHTMVAMVTCPPSLVCCSIYCKVEWAVSIVSQVVDVSHGGQGGHHLQAGAVEDERRKGLLGSSWLLVLDDLLEGKVLFQFSGNLKIYFSPVNYTLLSYLVISSTGAALFDQNI